MREELSNNFIQGHNNYPRSAVDALRYCINYRNSMTSDFRESRSLSFIQGGNEQNKTNKYKKEQVARENKNKKNKKCLLCNKPGHFANECKYKDQIDQAQGPYTNLEVNRGRLVCKMSTLCPQGEGVHQFLHAVVMESLHSFSFSYILDL